VSLAVFLAVIVAFRTFVESLVKEHGWVVAPAMIIPMAVIGIGFGLWFDKRAKKPRQ
jgi:hypothetical protein